MEVLKLDASQVAIYEEQGFSLRAPLQQAIFEVLFTGDAPSVQLTWSQIRGSCQYITQTATGRRERVRFSII